MYREPQSQPSVVLRTRCTRMPPVRRRAAMPPRLNKMNLHWSADYIPRPGPFSRFELSVDGPEPRGLPLPSICAAYPY